MTHLITAMLQMHRTVDQRAAHQKTVLQKVAHQRVVLQRAAHQKTALLIVQIANNNLLS